MKKAFGAEKEREIQDYIIANANKNGKEICEELKENGNDITVRTVYRRKKEYKEMVSEAIAKMAPPSETLLTNLTNTVVRINELAEIYGKLKESLDNGMLWSTEKIVKRGVDGSQIINERVVLNDKLVYEMRGVLDDIAREVGGRTSRAVIEHRTSQDSIAFQSLIHGLREKLEKERTATPYMVEHVKTSEEITDGEFTEIKDETSCEGEIE